MPEAIGIAILAGIGASTTATVAGVSVATILGSVVVGGALVGGELLLSQLNQPKKTNEQQQAVLNQALAPRVRIYGRAMVGGTRNFWEARNGILYQGIMLASDQVDGIAEYWIGDTPVDTQYGEAGGNVLTSPWGSNVYFEAHLGEANQAASAVLLSRFGDVWTDQHQLRGITYVVAVFAGVKQKLFETIFPQGYQTQLRFVVRGARVWDTTLSQDPDNPATWTFSESPGHCILDYLRHSDGMRLDRSRRIDVSSFSAFHETCIEQVARKDGSLEPRYRIGGTYSFDEAPKDVLARMCATCDGQLVQGPSGKIGIRGGKWTAPVAGIDTKNIVTAQLSQGNDKLDTYNRLRISYTDWDNYYQSTELQARDDTASQSKIGVIDQSMDLIMVPSWTQAARLAKIRMAKDNPLWKGTLGTHLAALDTLGEPAIHVEYDPVPEIGAIMVADCVPTSFSIRGDITGCDVGIASLTSDAYGWNPASEEPPRPVTPQVIVNVETVDAPTITGVDTSHSAGALSWSASSRTDADAEADVKPSTGTDGDWLPMAIYSDELSAHVSPLTPGTSYDFRVRFTVGGVASTWSVTTGHTVTS